MKDEAQLMVEQGKFVPILLDVEKPPIGFASFQGVSLSGWNRRDAQGLSNLVETLVNFRAGTMRMSGATANTQRTRYNYANQILVALFVMLTCALAVILRDVSWHNEMVTFEDAVKNSDERPDFVRERKCNRYMVNVIVPNTYALYVSLKEVIDDHDEADQARYIVKLRSAQDSGRIVEATRTDTPRLRADEGSVNGNCLLIGRKVDDRVK